MITSNRRAFLLIALLLGAAQTFAQTPEKEKQDQPSRAKQANPQDRVRTHQSVAVTAQLTPEEVEEGKINDAYQTIYQIQENHDCERAVEQYRSVVIPLAEQAKFDVPRNKFLFLAYRGIGDCYVSLGRFAEAEETFQKILQYAPVWPGTNDSAFPINYRSIGLAQMSQQKWKDAEGSLQKSIALLDEQIERAVHSDSEFMRSGHANNLRLSQDVALNLLAVVCFRLERFGEALGLLERAYDQAVKYHAPSTIIKRIVENGVIISKAAGDTTANASWSQRTSALK